MKLTQITDWNFEKCALKETDFTSVSVILLQTFNVKKVSLLLYCCNTLISLKCNFTVLKY